MSVLALNLFVCVALLVRVVEAQAIATNVLLISVDGMHQSDLDWYVQKYPSSTMASIVANGISFTKAHTPFPSDSFPGMVGIATGGNPSSTGIYYDDVWNKEMFPAGTTDCTSAAAGVEVTHTENLDYTTVGAVGWALDAGQGLLGLPGSILSMTGTARDRIDPTKLPVDPITCLPMYPYQYLKVNTMFEVIREAGMRTAWCDKHPAYDILNGPSGSGIQDLFTPEINSDAPFVGSTHDWTSDNLLTRQYDNYKVQAVVNQIKGYDHSGINKVGVPAVYGMNFQSISTAQKLPTIVAGVVTGGYMADGTTPGPLLSAALHFLDTQLALFTNAIAHGPATSKDSTVIILTAKHGQAPKKPSALIRINDGNIMSALNAAWNLIDSTQPSLVALTADDDGMQVWLNDSSDQALHFAKNFIMTYSGTGTSLTNPAVPFTQSGLVAAYSGSEACNFYGVICPDPRVPDIVGIAAYGVVYTGGVKKIAEHGGFNTEDRNVPLVVSGKCLPSANAGASVSSNVFTVQVAPTLLTLLGLDPFRLAAVQIEGTEVLPLSYTVTSKGGRDDEHKNLRAI